jgi:WD40-like Beta Propeller Repeat
MKRFPVKKSILLKSVHSWRNFFQSKTSRPLFPLPSGENSLRARVRGKSQNKPDSKSIHKNSLLNGLTVLILVFLLTACSETTTPIIGQTQGSAPTSTGQAQGIAPTQTFSPVVGVQPTDEPVTLVPDPQSTVAFSVQATPTPVLTPAGNIPAPLPLLTSAPSTDKTLPKNHFVIATRDGLYLVNLDGNPVRSLASNATFRKPKIAPDGSAVVASRTDPISRKTVLFFVPAQGNPKPLDIANNLVLLNWEWSPDSKSLALTLAEDNNGDGRPTEIDNPSLWLYDLAANKNRRLTNGSNPVWSPDGKTLFYTVSEPLQNDLDPSTNKPRRLPNTLELYTLQTNSKRPLLNAKNLTVDTKEVQATLRYFKATAWSPDGKMLYTAADALLKNNTFTGLILAFTLDNPAPRLITTGGNAITNLKLTKDGKNLLFETEPQYPVNTKSAYTVQALSLENTPKTPENIIGRAAWQAEAQNALWLDNNQIAYLEGSNAEILVLNKNGSNLRLLSGCLGYDLT